MPTFGRPRMATPISSVTSSWRAAPGIAASRSTMRSSRSPEPVPCRPETGTGSPRPSAWNSTASRSTTADSALLATTIVGTFARRRIAGDLLVARADADAGVDHEQHEVGLGHGLARLLRDLAGDARALDVDAAGVDEAEAAGRSTRRRRPCGRASRPGTSCTTVSRRPGEPVDERRLADVREADDGHRAGEHRGWARPRRARPRGRRAGGGPAAARGARGAPRRHGPRRCAGRWCSSRRLRVSRAAGAVVGPQEVVEPPQLVLDALGADLVGAHRPCPPARSSGMPTAMDVGVKPGRPKPSSGRGRRPARTGTPAAHREHRRAGAGVADLAGLLPRALDEDAEHLAVVEHRARRAQGLAVGLRRGRPGRRRCTGSACRTTGTFHSSRLAM